MTNEEEEEAKTKRTTKEPVTINPDKDLKIFINKEVIPNSIKGKITDEGIKVVK